MKKALAFLLLPLCAWGQQSTSLTPNLGLQVPAYGNPNWQVPIIYDLNLLDQILGGTQKLPVLPLAPDGSPLASQTYAAANGGGGGGSGNATSILGQTINGTLSTSQPIYVWNGTQIVPGALPSGVNASQINGQTVSGQVSAADPIFAWNGSNLVPQPFPTVQPFFQFNFAGQPSVTTSDLAVNDTYGNVVARALPNLSAPTITTALSPGSSTYTYALKAWVGGSYMITPAASTNVTPPGSGTTLTISIPVPPGITHYQLYRNSSSDSGLSAGMIAEADLTISGQPGAAQTVSFNETYSAPINTNTIPAVQLGMNGTGGIRIGRAVPESRTEPCHTGEQVYGPAPEAVGTGNGTYHCYAEDTWDYVPATPTGVAW